VQIIWAGKPYPEDGQAIDVFNTLVAVSRRYANCATMTGYELALSRNLKQAADLWLNTPRIPQEASGTSGMTAAMNGAVNFSTMDGWVPEYMKSGINGFAIPVSDPDAGSAVQDEQDTSNLFTMLTEEIIPLFYKQHERWQQIMMQGMKDVRAGFESGRLADEYYEKLYTD
jgi:starch phosphorylase